ncbi:Uncharacterised protein [Acinetobacter pittii]|nr:Uncharacterised protein [Acinetobacter pittii]
MTLPLTVSNQFLICIRTLTGTYPYQTLNCLLLLCLFGIPKNSFK